MSGFAKLNAKVVLFSLSHKLTLGTSLQFLHHIINIAPPYRSRPSIRLEYIPVPVGRPFRV